MNNLSTEQKLQKAHVQITRSNQFALLVGILMMGKIDLVGFVNLTRFTIR